MGPGIVRSLSRPGQFLAAVLVLASAASNDAFAATAEAVDRSSLRVCADPSNLPFSNQAGEGFENKIAELLANELDVPVRYTWFPQATGFVRNTLMARKCDLVIGISLGFELLQNTNPYYRSSYSLVYRSDTEVAISSLEHPSLKQKRIGVIAGTPPATLLARYGLMNRVRPYHLVADTRFNKPGKQMIEDITSGAVDVGILWGPIAGYFAKQHNTPLSIVPLLGKPGETRLDYRITMGVRFNEPDWKRQINDLLQQKQDDINGILMDYGVPLLDAKGEPISN